jgi:hypothetical protein
MPIEFGHTRDVRLHAIPIFLNLFIEFLAALLARRVLDSARRVVPIPLNLGLQSG